MINVKVKYSQLITLVFKVLLVLKEEWKKGGGAETDLPAAGSLPR